MLLARGQAEYKQLLAPFILLSLLAILALFLKVFLPGWILMWLLAFAVFLAFKVFSLLNVTGTLDRAKLPAYFLAWPDMNAESYFQSTPAQNRVTAWDWLIATAKTIAGAILLFSIARKIYQFSPLLGGWSGFFGFICFLHFGLFSLLTLFWRSTGIEALPIMNSPASAKSVGEFWSRWNVAFRQVARAFVFKPASRVLGPRYAMFVTFLFSGLLHDLIISLPAGAGFGLPTLYFLIQSAGIFVERYGMRRYPGRLFTALVVVVPVPILFHPPFVRQVVVPFLRAIGAL